MATKPTNLARWAETAGGTPASGITEPTSGKKDTGWVPAEEPPAQTFNWWQWQIYQWIKYLSDGALTGNHSIQKSAVGDSSTLVIKDPLGNNRFTVDHLGLPGGQITTWEEDWRATGTTAPTGWTFTASGGAAATLSDPSTVLPFRRLVLTTAAASGAIEAKTNNLFSCDTNTVVVYEQIIRTGAAIDSGTSIFFDARTGARRD